MTILDRHFAVRLLSTICMILVSLVLLVAVIDVLVSRQDNIVKYQVPPLVVLQYYVFFTPTILFEFHAAAIGVLIAGLVVMGRAAQDNEITAALAGGVSLFRIARAPVLVALLIAGGAFVFEDTLGVAATRRLEDIDARYFSKISDTNRAGVSWKNLSDGWTCHILAFNRRARTGQDVYLHRIAPDRVDEIRAGRIYWDETRGEWMLENGRQAVFDPARSWEVRANRITQAPAPFTETPEALFALEAPSRAKTARRLAADIRSAAAMGVPVLKQRVEYHLKFAQPALCFIMILLAVPFAVRLRRGGIGIGFGVAVAIGLAYLSIFYAGIGLGYLDKLPPALAAWLANAVFFALGIVLFKRSAT